MQKGKDLIVAGRNARGTVKDQVVKESEMRKFLLRKGEGKP